MRKVAGVLCAAALMLPVAVVASGPAGAVGGTTCKTTSGPATFKPGLPKIGDSHKVLATVTVVGGKIGGCTGGGVTSGVISLTGKFSKPGNCSTLATSGSTNPVKGTQKITWNNKKTSTIAVTLVGVKGKPTQAKVSGTVTAGLFKGLKESGVVVYTPQKDGCTKIPLSKVTFKQVTATSIK